MPRSLVQPENIDVEALQSFEIHRSKREVMEVHAGTAVRVAPEVASSVWNEGPDDAILIMVSKKLDDPLGDTEQVADFWPA